MVVAPRPLAADDRSCLNRFCQFCCPEIDWPFVVLVNEEKSDLAANERGKLNHLNGEIFTITFLMNYPYSSLVLEAQKAKRELSRAFPSSSNQGVSRSVSAEIKGRTTEAARPVTVRSPRTVSRIFLLSSLLNHPRKRVRFPNGFYWMREDMGAVSFILTLVLLGSAAAAQTDQPAFWLLVGPAPLAAGFLAVSFFRRRLLRSVGVKQCQCQ